MASHVGERARAMHARLMVDLAAIVGESHVISEEALLDPYCVDWTRRFHGPALCVVRPANTEEVSAIARACTAAGVPMLPQGGNTGLVGGSVPAGRDTSSDQPSELPVMVSMRRIAWVDPVDELSAQVSVGAGTTLGNVQRHARAAGLEYGVDLASRDSATIGGTVATNAGGIRVLAYGMTRLQVTGIEAVLPDGSVISHMSGLAKDNTGLDLAQLLCGSEGALAIITAVRLRLHRPHGRTSVALIGCADYDDALTVIGSATQGRLVAAEVIDATGMRLVQDVSGLPYPLELQHPLLALIEVADGGSGDGFVADVLETRDVVVALDASGIERLWQYRERQTEGFDAWGIVHKLDVSVPLEMLAACARELQTVIAEFPKVKEFGIFGHLADGNIHVEILGPPAEESDVDTAVLECISRYGGSISAEHGIGRMKVDHLDLSRSPEEITTMRAIKKAWDPQGLMNPGVLLPVSGEKRPSDAAR